MNGSNGARKLKLTQASRYVGPRLANLMSPL